MKRTIVEILRDWNTEHRPQFYPNKGNAGDALIAAATWQVFDRLGMRPKVSRPADFRAGGEVILGGGGNLVPYYSDMANALEACLRNKVARCLLLPHSIHGHEELLARLDNRFSLVCREQASFEHARRFAPAASVFLADDMAFGIDFEILAKRVAGHRHQIALILDPSWRRNKKRWRAALEKMQPDGDGRLVILRTDREAASNLATDAALDPPYAYQSSCVGRAGCDQVAMDLHDLLKNIQSVRTDRLHIAIPAALLGVNVEIIENSYGKLGAVWRNSVSATRDAQ